MKILGVVMLFLLAVGVPGLMFIWFSHQETRQKRRLRSTAQLTDGETRAVGTAAIRQLERMAEDPVYAVSDEAEVKSRKIINDWYKQ